MKSSKNESEPDRVDQVIGHNEIVGEDRIAAAWMR